MKLAHRSYENLHAWNRFSGNELALKYCLGALGDYDGAVAKAICLNAPTGSGGSALLSQIASRAVKRGRRVLYLDDGLYLGNRYLASKIMRSMGIGIVNVEGSDGLTMLCAETMRLRRYDAVIIDDVQKYTQAAKRVAQSNSQAILQMTCLPKPPFVIMSGSADAIETYHANFICAGISAEVKFLAPMKFDESYIQFVEAFFEANPNMRIEFKSLDLDALYRQSQGRVGLTVRNLDWLHLKTMADRSCCHELQMQAGQVVEDDYSH
ncbi:ATP-binding protein [Pseudomonas sp. ANT_J12]|uniref:ATP-binding protein n=1 Tax=Pseudomonas sp. ANT_J12 TaxID=2597351 RepID=UPI0011F1569B|nr:ATP-binding protein [Pseudomonas sp. ANT_J12]KAA0987317.1 ATP-binding protein [Pseudomonas sp. ANT_J12]